MIDVLRQELADDPENRGYSSLTDAQCAVDLNDKRYTAYQETWVTDRTILAKLDDGEAIMQVLESAAEQSPEIARAVKWLNPAEGGINVADPKVRQQIDGLVEAQLLTPTQGVALKGLADSPVSRAEVLGLGTVHHLQVAEARNGDV